MITKSEGVSLRLKSKISREELYDCYIVKKMSIGKIEDLYHIDHTNIHRLLIAYGIPQRSRYYSYQKRNIPEDILRKMYEGEGLSITVIAEKFGVNHSLILNRINEYGIPIRSRAAYKGQRRSPETEFKSEKSHPNWKGGNTIRYYTKREFQQVRKIILKRDGYTCQLCGNKEKQLIGHHLIPYRISKNNDVENLITVCAHCHRIVENYYWKNTKRYMNIFYEQWGMPLELKDCF